MNWLLLWKYKSWIAIAVLSFVCIGQLAYTNHLAGELDKTKAAHKLEIAEAKATTLAKEKKYSENLLKAEQNAIEKSKLRMLMLTLPILLLTACQSNLPKPSAVCPVLPQKPSLSTLPLDQTYSNIALQNIETWRNRVMQSELIKSD